MTVSELSWELGLANSLALSCLKARRFLLTPTKFHSMGKYPQGNVPRRSWWALGSQAARRCHVVLVLVICLVVVLVSSFA